MEFKPYAYQQYCIDTILALPKCGLLLEMGLGKSVIALSAVKKLRYDTFTIRKCLVIAPKTVAEGTWIQEAKKWDHLSLLRMQLVTGTARHRVKALLTPADVYVIGRDNVVWLVDYYRNAWPFDCVIIDESSSFKNPQAKRFKALDAMYSHIDRCVLLTGTPAPNKIEDLWAQIKLIDNGARLGRYITHFRGQYMDETKEYGRGGTTHPKYTPKTGADQAVLNRISDICVSMNAEDYIELPEIIYDTIPVTLDDKARKQYTDLERKLVLELVDGEEVSVASAAALSNKLLQLANGAIYDEEHAAHEIHRCKLDALIELLESLQERGKNALVFYSFQHDRDRIMDAVPTARLLQDSKDIAAWNAGEIPVLLAHPASAGYGLNLQDGGHHAIWYGLNWSYELYTQANARLHRQGQTEKVIVHQLIATGTRDEDVVTALEGKDNTQNLIMETLKARIARIRSEARA